MYKYKNGRYTFYQPKEIRKVGLVEFGMIIASFFVVYKVFPSRFEIKAIFISFIISVYVLGKSLAPILIRRYNVIISEDLIILEVYGKSVKILKIKDIVKIDERIVKLTFENNKNNIQEVEIKFDEGEADKFIEILRERKLQEILKIREAIDKSLT